MTTSEVFHHDHLQGANYATSEVCSFPRRCCVAETKAIFYTHKNESANTYHYFCTTTKLISDNIRQD